MPICDVIDIKKWSQNTIEKKKYDSKNYLRDKSEYHPRAPLNTKMDSINVRGVGPL